MVGRSLHAIVRVLEGAVGEHGRIRDLVEERIANGWIGIDGLLEGRLKGRSDSIDLTGGQ